MYVVIEGIDTAGKSTQIAMLRQAFPDALFTKEPGGSPLGQTLRTMLLETHDYSPRAEFFLFLADRAEHIDKVLRPARDRLIISDRSLVSGIAYADPSLDRSFLIDANRFSVDGLFPDKTVMLKLSPDELARRLAAKTHDGIEQRGIDYLLSIQSRMETTIGELDLPSLILDASLPVARIHDRICRFIHS